MKASLVLAFDLGGTKLACAAVDSTGRIHARRTQPVDLRSLKAPIDQIVRLAHELSKKAGKPRAAAIAVPGLVRRSGRVWAPNLPGWKNVPLRQKLEERLGVPVSVESDRNCAVLGEVWCGAARGKSDVVALIVGTGIGAGILAGGQILRGAHELSGCAGWMVITEDEREDFLRTGTLEALAAGPAIACSSGKKRSAAELASMARAGDKRAKHQFNVAGQRLGLAVANLISLLDPQIVVLGGGLAGAADLFLDELKRTALRRAQPIAATQVQIRVSKLAGDANLLGAAKLAFQARARR